MARTSCWKKMNWTRIGVERMNSIASAAGQRTTRSRDRRSRASTSPRLSVMVKASAVARAVSTARGRAARDGAGNSSEKTSSRLGGDVGAEPAGRRLDGRSGREPEQHEHRPERAVRVAGTSASRRPDSSVALRRPWRARSSACPCGRRGRRGVQRGQVTGAAAEAARQARSARRNRPLMTCAITK